MNCPAPDRAGRTADRAFPDENSGVIMASTGARGSTLNIGQMTADIRTAINQRQKNSEGLP